MAFHDYAPTAEVGNQSQESGQPPEPGLYEVELHEIKAFTSKAGADYVIAEFQVFTGPLKGHQWTVFQGFKSQEQTNVTFGFCAAIGIDPKQATSLDELEAMLKRFEGAYYVVEVVENGSFLNTYVRDRIKEQAPTSDVPSDFPSADEIAEARAAAEAEATEPLPWE